MLIPAVMAIMVAAAVPAVTQTPTPTVSSPPQPLYVQAPVLTAPTTMTLIGVLVDVSCYVGRGKTAMGPGNHEKCAIVCAQRGNRLALVTSTGDVYMLVGGLTQNDNAGLLQFVNQTVVMTGTASTVAIIIPDPPPTGKNKTDNRRPAGTEDGVAVVVKKGDSRQGDNYAGTETVLDGATIALSKPISPAG